MAPYNPMKKHMDKLDEWGSAQAKKINSQRDAGGSASLSDRLNLARGRDDRWERSQKTSTDPNEDPNNIVPTRSARVGHLPPAPAPAVARAAVPPPPQRTGAVPPPPARSSTATTAAGAAKPPPPPVLPRRMDNENGTTNPPPPYGVAATRPPAPPARKPSQASVSTSADPGYTEFSKFDADDKEAFFSMLDEYFAARLNISLGESSSHRSAQTVASPFQSTDTAAAATFPTVKTTTSIKRDPPKPTGHKPQASIKVASPPPTTRKQPSSSGSAWKYEHLTASNHPASEPCKALGCASFLVYRDSYPEWSGTQPWFVKPNALPCSLQGRRDIAWSSSSSYRGSDHILTGASLFEDLSFLWWRISWNAQSPASTARVDAAYREPPAAWSDEGRLVEASRGFGDWIAGFAEQSEQARTPVGDGECWTLAAEAIKYTNQTAQLTADNRLLTSIGRTHGHLIFAAKADPIKGQCGRWRGGDRVHGNLGGVRRGDIIEWRTAKCREWNGPRGSYVTLGAPEHTAIIIENAPVPARLSESKGKEKLRTGSSSGDDFYSLLGVKPSATQSEIRSAYLSGARKHHPDRHGVGHDDEHIQRLNEAHAVLSDVTLRAEYDARLQSGRQGRGYGSNATRVSATVDLDAMEVVDDGTAEKLTFYYACRCGGGFYVNEDQLQLPKPTVSCTGCSEQIRIVSGQDDVDANEGEDDNNVDLDDDDDEQPELAPWELGKITTIEQSAGQMPTRRTYDLARDSFTQGEMWIYRPVWEKEILGGRAGGVQPVWPPNLSDWLALT